MKPIPALETLIQLEDDTWHLYEPDQATPIVTANANGFAYNMRFGMMRQLPDNGHLLLSDILQVVLGWQVSDQMWHLGLILAPDLAQARNSRWCEVASWYDPYQISYQSQAQEAGEHLAKMLGLPFQMVEPTNPPVHIEPIPLPNLPLEFGLWSLRTLETDTHLDDTPVKVGQLALVLSPRWAWQQLLQAGWSLLWAVAYTVLSLATLRSDLALPNAGTLIPNPQWLPYLGLLIAVSLLFSTLYTVYGMFTKVSVLVLDPDAQAISGWRGKQRVWQYTVNDVEAVYVSEVSRRRNNRNETTDHGELNLHLGGKRFYHLLLQGEAVNNADYMPAVQRPTLGRDAVYPLRNGEACTALQAAALYVATILGDKPVYFDRRVR